MEGKYFELEYYCIVLAILEYYCIVFAILNHIALRKA